MKCFNIFLLRAVFFHFANFFKKVIAPSLSEDVSLLFSYSETPSESEPISFSANVALLLHLRFEGFVYLALLLHTSVRKWPRSKIVKMKNSKSAMEIFISSSSKILQNEKTQKNLQNENLKKELWKFYVYMWFGQTLKWKNIVAFFRFETFTSSIEF